MKNPSDLNGLLGFASGAGIDLNNINDLACRFKSPRNQTHISSGRKLSKTPGSFGSIAAALSSRPGRLMRCFDAWRPRASCRRNPEGRGFRRSADAVVIDRRVDGDHQAVALDQRCGLTIQHKGNVFPPGEIDGGYAHIGRPISTKDFMRLR